MYEQYLHLFIGTDFSSVQSLSHVWLLATMLLCPSATPVTCSNSCPWLDNAIQPSSSLLSPSLLPSTFSASRSFFRESGLCIRWPKYWRFSFSISPSNEHPGLISFRMDWLDLLAVQGTLKSLLQHHSSKASILQCPAIFMAQLSHPYMTTGETIAVTMWTFVGKVRSLLFNILSSFVRAFFPSRKHLLISWQQSTCAMILEPKKIRFPWFTHLFAMNWWDQMPWFSFLNV